MDGSDEPENTSHAIHFLESGNDDNGNDILIEQASRCFEAPMTLGDLLRQIREYYLIRFKKGLEEIQRSGKQSAISEEVLLTSDGKPARGGVLQLPMRVDLIVVENGRVVDSIRIDTEKMLTFAPFELIWDGMSVCVSGFKWNEMRFTCTSGDTPISMGPLQEWFSKWFFEQDSAPRDGFLELIHFLSDPSWQASSVIFEVDMGSAPVDAFEDLLDVLASLHIKKVEFGSQPMQRASE